MEHCAGLFTSLRDSLWVLRQCVRSATVGVARDKNKRHPIYWASFRLLKTTTGPKPEPDNKEDFVEKHRRQKSIRNIYMWTS